MPSRRPDYTEIVTYIKRYIDANKVSPSFQDIAQNTRLSSVSHVAHVLEILEEEGHIHMARKESGHALARGISMATPPPVGRDLAIKILEFESNYSYAPDDWVLLSAQTDLNAICDMARLLVE